MKLKLITIIALLFLAIANAKAQYVNLPDSNFRNDLRSKWPGAFNASGQMDTSNFQIITANQLVSINANIKDLTGVKYFKNITSLLCSGNQLTTLPELPPLLNSIYCHDNQFTNIPPLPSSVILLSIYNNQITAVNSLPNSLRYLIVNNNPIIIIDSLPSQLISLSCSFTSLKSLPTLPNNLEQLVCANNKIKTLPALPATLTELTCTEDSLVSLPALPASLIYLYCSKNFLQNLPTLPNQLTELECRENKLTFLPALPQTLKYLKCAFNQLAGLPTLSDSLIFLSCNNNLLSTLPALPNKLQSLYCNNNVLNSLPQLPSLLETINCESNNLNSLPLLPVSLNFLSCAQNLLQTLPPLPLALKYFYTANNLLINLPSLPSSLRNFDCSNNQITTLAFLPDSLESLDVSTNQLSSLPKLPNSLSILSVGGNVNLKCLPYLPKSLTNFNFAGTGISCIPNIPVNCLFIPSNPDICVATNNVNQCNSFPQIYGFVYNDNNSNGIFDSGDLPRENIKVKLNNGNYAITNLDGYFNITADTIGSYRTDIDPPLFYSPVPFSNIHFFTSYSDVVYDTFALQPTLVKDSLSIHILPIEQKARPGFPFSYFVQCENVGTTILNTEMQMHYDTSRLVFDSASVSGIISNPETLILTIGNMGQGQQQTFISYFHLKQNAVIGDSLNADAVAKALAVSSFDTTISPISGSYDPNSKQATPVLTPTQVASGGFIEYIIHFQNTGNDTAFNIVIADTLSPKLRTNFLQMLGTSHPCRTTLGFNYITFEFLRINLPDSGTNANGSKGFIHFRIRPDSTLTIGDSVSNKASIYFDFNTPFVTNTCQTHIKATVLPLRLINFTSKMQTNNTVLNEWVTANEINTSYFNIQRSNNGKDFMTIGKVIANGGNHTNSYEYRDDLTLITPSNRKSSAIYYRLELIDKDGRRAYSAIQAVTFSPTDTYSIYPNPASNIVNIIGDNIALVSIKDLSGRELLTKSGMNEKAIEINISTLPKGSYLLKITKTNEKINIRLLIVE